MAEGEGADPKARPCLVSTSVGQLGYSLASRSSANIASASPSRNEDTRRDLEFRVTLPEAINAFFTFWSNQHTGWPAACGYGRPAACGCDWRSDKALLGGGALSNVSSLASLVEGRETSETSETEHTSGGLDERLLATRGRQRSPVGPGAGWAKPPRRSWGAAPGAGPSGAGCAVISAAGSMACKSEKPDAHRWRTGDFGGRARPMVRRMRICSQSPVQGQ